MCAEILKMSALFLSKYTVDYNLLISYIFILLLGSVLNWNIWSQIPDKRSVAQNSFQLAHDDACAIVSCV